jgi:hypothetical protein
MDDVGCAEHGSQTPDCDSVEVSSRAPAAPPPIGRRRALDRESNGPVPIEEVDRPVGNCFAFNPGLRDNMDLSDVGALPSLSVTSSAHAVGL